MDAKKAKKTVKPKAGRNSKQEDSLVDAANKVWAAGLGALRTAEDRGAKLFKQLLEKGEDFQAEHRKSSQKQIDKIGEIVKGGLGSVKGKLDDITFQKEGLWDKIGMEEAFRSVMKTFGVATNKEIDVLKKKIDALTKAVNEMKGARKRA
jgi:poly(hydroxyalkanoate) granule-associated protein